MWLPIQATDEYVDYDYYLEDVGEMGGYLRLTLFLGSYGRVEKASVFFTPNDRDGAVYTTRISETEVDVEWALAVTGWQDPKCANCAKARLSERERCIERLQNNEASPLYLSPTENSDFTKGYWSAVQYLVNMGDA